MFIGYFDLDSDLFALYQALNDSSVPTAATGSPTFRILSSEGLMTNGTGTATAFDSGSSTGLYSATKTLAAADGYERGRLYYIRFQATVSATVKTALASFIVT